MDNRDYYIGLDIGTSSVVWAVTDENYKLLRAKGKDLSSVFKFFTFGKSSEGVIETKSCILYFFSLI